MTESEQKQEYRVLARKYRPRNFDEMIGQDALVRTLSNALESGRLHHAYMLHGIRGVGKTTTARIMARALNYGDKNTPPTADFSELTDQCKMIIEGRHVDVIEMDAASNTGVDNIREIIDSVQYAPVSARYKVYIIDEVHMLSKSAFNALLKTLEEPPEHVKFIFATTEIRKVPVTVLSRCQRFDLKRVDQKTLEDYFKTIVEKEKAKADDEAIALISRAADGSVRDGLSLLDQAIALGDGNVETTTVRDMLGLADRTKILDLFDYCLTGRATDALDLADDLYRSGADPLVIIQDMLDVTHFMTKAKSMPALVKDSNLPEAEKMKGEDLAGQLTVPILTRTWQLLLKGIGEVSSAPNPQSALEMVLIRLLYTSDMPTPGDLIKKLENGELSVSDDQKKKRDSVKQAGEYTQSVRDVTVKNANGKPTTMQVIETTAISSPQEDAHEDDLLNPQNFVDVVRLFEKKREIMIASNLRSFTRLVSFKKGVIEINVLDNAMPKLPSVVSKYLSEWTGEPWMVSVSTKQGEPSLTEQHTAQKQAQLKRIEARDDVQTILTAFPGAVIHEIKSFQECESDE